MQTTLRPSWSAPYAKMSNMARGEDSRRQAVTYPRKHLEADGRLNASGHPGAPGHPERHTGTQVHPSSSGARPQRPGAGPAARAFEERTGIKAPRIIAWEITRSCNLACAHCRAAAHCAPYPGELSLPECKRVMNDIASITDPILILTGGEPLMRTDLWEIIDYARERGLHPVIGTNGTLIDEECAAKIAAHGIPRVSVSLDFPTAEGQDAFRGKAGAFDEAITGIRNLRANGVGVQVNTTITKMNNRLLDEMHELALAEDAAAFHPFLLVPTGRGEDLLNVELSPDEYEEVLTWAYRCQKTSPLHFKPTDAPQYYRIIRQLSAKEGRAVTPQTYGMEAMTRGCLGGITFAFISHIGDVQPCGYFDMQLGNVKETPFSEIWEHSPVFDDLRHYDRLRGKCGACEYKGVCGGCRARALAATGDYLAAEPYCAYVPHSLGRRGEAESAAPPPSNAAAAATSPSPKEAPPASTLAAAAASTHKLVLDEIQSGFPLTHDPYATLAERLGLARADVISTIESLREDGTIRQICASLSSRKLGYTSTLCAMAVRGEQQEVDRIANLVSAHTEVTHNYLRDAEPNLWFTAIAPSEAHLAHLVREIASETGVEVLNLPVTALYKIRVDFGAAPASLNQAPAGKASGSANGLERFPAGKTIGDARGQAPPGKPAEAPFDAENAFDVALVRWAQKDVTAEHPFSEAAAFVALQTGDATVDESRVIARLEEWKRQGLIRRFGAFVRHRKLGYAFNGMTVWDIPADKEREVGLRFAELPFVSHCYGRSRLETWPYNLYAMVHGKTRQELDAYVDQLKAIANAEPRILVSTKEYKKALPTYFPA